MTDEEFHARNCTACQRGKDCRTAREIAGRR